MTQWNYHFLYSQFTWTFVIKNRCLWNTNAPFPNILRIGLTFDLLTWISIGIIYSSRTIYLPSLKLCGQIVLEFSVAQGVGDPPTNQHTNRCKTICPSFFKGGRGHNNLKLNFILMILCNNCETVKLIVWSSLVTCIKLIHISDSTSETFLKLRINCINDINYKSIVAAFQGMHVSPAKHSFVWLPRKCDYRTDTQTDGRTDRCRTKWSLCAAMLRKRHKN